MQSQLSYCINLHWPHDLPWPREQQYWHYASTQPRHPEAPCVLPAHLHLCHHHEDMPRLVGWRKWDIWSKAKSSPPPLPKPTEINQPPDIGASPATISSTAQGTTADSRCIGRNCLLLNASQVSWQIVTQHGRSYRNAHNPQIYETGSHRWPNLSNLVREGLG